MAKKSKQAKKNTKLKAKADSLHTAQQKRKFEFYSDPHKACKNLKGTRKSVEDCIAHAKKFTKDYLAKEYPDTTKADTTKKKSKK